VETVIKVTSEVVHEYRHLFVNRGPTPCNPRGLIQKARVLERIGTLVSNVNPSPEEDLGDEALI
jgi:hypothetical protein